MGEKGTRLSAAATERAEAVVAEWQPLGAVTSRKMFGGHGIFIDDKMFALLDSTAQLYLKADASSSAPFEEAGSEKHGRMPYWSVPHAVLDDEEELRSWAQRSADLARS